MNTETSYTSEKGWECPRCGRINAPWVRQCDCPPSTTSTWGTITVNPYDEWWKTSETFKIHPESTIYTTSVNQGQQLNYNCKFNNQNKSEDK